MDKMRWMFLAFALIGVALLLGGAYQTHRMREFLARSDTAQGLVIENVWRQSSSRNRNSSGTYYPRVRFRTRTGREVEFLSNTGSSPASYQPDDPVEVVYDPDKPGDAYIKSFWSVWLGTVILSGLGSVFVAAGIGPLTWMRHRRKVREWVRANGVRIETAVERVELDTSLTVNGSHPYRIVSQWLNPATNQVHVFKSDSLWYNPAKHLETQTIAVWIDPHRPKRYFMDTDFLPRIAK